MSDELGVETRRELRLDRIERSLADLKSDFENFVKDSKARDEKRDQQQGRILWAVVGLILTIAGTVMGAALVGVLPHP